MSNSLDLLVMDLETGSRDKAYGEVLEIGCVYADMFDDGTYRVKGEFHSLVQPTRWERVTDEALKVNGIKREELLKAPLSVEVRQDFNEWWTEIVGHKVTILGQNFGMFDSHFIERFMPSLVPYMFDYHAEDTWAVARVLQRVGILPEDLNLSLTSLTDYLGVPHRPHKALGDAYATLNVYGKLIRLLRAGI